MKRPSRSTAIADAGLLPSHRVAALQRGARLLDRMDGDRLEAAHWYTRLADHVGSHAERADALARAGSAYRAAGSPQASADAYYGAWEAAPEESDAPERLLAAAQSLALAGEGKRAMSVLEQLDAPSVADRLCLTRGDLLLEVGDLQGALEEYEEAARLASTDGIRVAARQGAASCLERLANLDEALVDLR